MKLKYIILFLTFFILVQPNFPLDLTLSTSLSNGPYLHSDRERILEDLFVEPGPVNKATYLLDWKDSNQAPESNNSYNLGFRLSHPVGPGKIVVDYDYIHMQASGRAYAFYNTATPGSYEMVGAYGGETDALVSYEYPFKAYNLKVRGGAGYLSGLFRYDARFNMVENTSFFYDRQWQNVKTDYSGFVWLAAVDYSPIKDFHLDASLSYAPDLSGDYVSSGQGSGVIDSTRVFEFESVKSSYKRSELSGMAGVRYETEKSGFVAAIGFRYRSMNDSRSSLFYIPHVFLDQQSTGYGYSNSLNWQLNWNELASDMAIQSQVKKKSVREAVLTAGWKFADVL